MYFLKILAWCLLAVVIGLGIGFLGNSFEYLMDKMFEVNSDLAVILLITAVVCALIMRIQRIIKKCKKDEVYKSKVIDELKLLIIGIISISVLMLIIILVMFYL